ncbi:MAG: ATP-dependent RNA helicase HrpA [Actinomycetaceae bacterium]|nr:ATP-dependent RNA helicase HrpA [Actinomycetaceae bacterium]
MSTSHSSDSRAPGNSSRAGRERPAAHTRNRPRSSQGQHRRRPPARRTPQFQLTAEQLEHRRSITPKISYPEDLPVSARRADIMAAIDKNQVVIVAGETGSGKTTQLPKICLELGRGINGLIGHTQPRRIAARSVAERICTELGVELGGAIGYQVRFTEHVSADTLVKLMTDGILLAEIQSDPELRRYDTIIIDEAHERSLNIDFLLGYLAQLLPKRPDLKLIITSATIDSERFAEHFGEHMYGGFPGNKAPIIEVSGRTYPVEIRYRPLYDDAGASEVSEFVTRAESRDQVTGILDAAEELMAETDGDILVFLSGEGEIRDVQKAFADELGNRYIEPGGRSTVPGAVEVLPLFARLSAAEQHRIFQPHRHRRIVLATNIAETSLTVPGITSVIDPGTARISRYSNRTKVQRLPIEEISQASANQRSGRSGRLSPGIAIRLYSEEDFQQRPEFTEPEIQRTSLAAVILQMASLGLGQVVDFPFIDPPDMRAVNAGVQLLEEIGALDPQSRTPRLTATGRKLARLPIDPRLGRMLLAAVDNGAAAEVLVLVAAMSVQDVRERPAEFKAQSDQLHARFTEPNSDFLAYLNLWRYLRTQQRELSGSAFRRLCRAEYLNWLRFREWQDVVAQLRQLAKPLGITLRPITIPNAAQLRAAENDGKDTSHNQAVIRAVKKVGASSDAPAADAIHRSLLVGLLSNIGNWDERKRDYVGARGTHFVIWPGSGLAKRNPDWVMAAELVETSRLFARSVARIDPAWIERVGAHLVKKTYSEPYWSTRDGAAKVHEKVTLYGLTVIADRRVLLSKVGTPSAKELARELFIRHALVENQWRTHHRFVKDNKEALRDAREVEERLRTHGLVADEHAQFVFFDERVPDHIVSARHFDSWWKRERGKRPDLLNFTREFLLGETTASDADYPNEWIQGNITLPIDYHFTPGKHSDGLTIDVPVTLLPQLTDDGFDWLVPGMLDELVVSTIRALPKRIRRNLVPAPDVAREIRAMLPAWEDVAHGQPGAPSFREAFSAAVRQLRQIDIDEAAWDEAVLPGHLEINFRVRSERGAVLDESTSITDLQRSLAPQTRSAVESVVKGAVAQALDEARAQILASNAAAEEIKRKQRVAESEKQRAELASRADATKLSTGVDELTTWPELKDGTLPDVIETTGPHDMVVRGYPALVETVDGKAVAAPAPGGKPAPPAKNIAVSLRVLAEPAEQIRDHRRGVIRLLTGELALVEGRVTSRWTARESLALAATPYPSTSALVADLQLAATRNLADRWAKQNKTPLGRLRTARAYETLRGWIRDRLEDEIYRLVQIVVRIMESYGEVDAKIRANTSLTLLATVKDVRDQLTGLVFDGFIAATPDSHIAHLPRYLSAAAYRLDRAGNNPAGDDALAWQVQEMEDLVQAASAEFAGGAYEAARAGVLVQARWMIEELRVSLFAQQLGTPVKVSAQRIRRLLG